MARLFALDRYRAASLELLAPASEKEDSEEDWAAIPEAHQAEAAAMALRQVLWLWALAGRKHSRSRGPGAPKHRARPAAWIQRQALQPSCAPAGYLEEPCRRKSA